MRNGFYFSFARLAIRLLLAIYRNQAHSGTITTYSRELSNESEAWLDKYK